MPFSVEGTRTTNREIIEHRLDSPRTEQRREELEAELRGPALPASMAYLFEWFVDLNMDRGGTGFGPTTITSGMINEWARGKGLRLTPTEFDALRALNRAWLHVYHELNP